MTPAPALSALGERLRERTAPLAPDDELHGHAHAHLCEAIAQMLAQVAEVYDPPDPLPPAAPLMDPAPAPDWALPWVGQLVGVRLPRGATAEQARTLISDVSGFSRGTPASLRAAAGLELTDTRTVYFNERKDDDAYHLEVATLVFETPDPALVLRRLLAEKPAGIRLEYRAVVGNSYGLLDARYDDYAELRLTYASYGELLTDTPTP